MDPTKRFSNRVENYRRYRPGYPSAVIDLIQNTCGPGPEKRMVDLGAGTGLFTRKLLEAGFEVTAIEPNEAMRLAAEEELTPFPRFHSVAAPAEETGLPDDHFAAVTAAQAFHWFDRERAQREFRRILEPEGWVFLIWNERRQFCSDFDRAYQELLATLGQAFEGVRDRSEDAGRNLEAFFRPGSFRTAHFDNSQIMTWEELRGRFLSSSYVPTEEDARHPELLARLEAIFCVQERKGYVPFSQQTAVYFGQL